jgi:hypothetical protein
MEDVMGKACAWCGAILRVLVGTSVPTSHALCQGCLEDLKTALSSNGLRAGGQSPHSH